MMLFLKQTIRTFLLLFLCAVNAQQTVIKAGYLINPKTEEISRNQFIIVKNDKITTITSKYKVTSKDTFINWSG